MAAFLLYIIKSTCCLTLFYLGYKALLGNETFFRFNRMVVLAGMLVCMLLPLVEIRTESSGVLQMPLLQLEEMITEGMGEAVWQHTAIQAETEVVPAVREVSCSWGTWIVYVYLAGMAIVLCRMVRSFVSLLWLIRAGEKIRKERYTLVLVGRPVTPFNWGPYIVLSLKDYCDYPNEILAHEQVHRRKHHSLDLIYTEVVLLLHWFNPAAWLLKRELQEIHEYQADTGVLKSGIDATRYQLLLVKKAVSASSYTFANSFNHSKIKKRITMMLKEKSNSWARLKLVLLVPVAACSMLAFARPDVNRELTNLVQSEGTTISSAGQPYTREFFDKEIDRYIEQAGGGQLSGSEKLAFMEKHTQKVDFFINAKDQILYNYKFAEMSEMPDKLKATLSASSGEKPVMIYFLCDKQTSDAAIEKALEAAGKAFTGYQVAAAGKNAPILFFFGDPRKDYHGSKNK
ncbi:M56 family metallopeptidase [Parabacteroides sp. ASD2025]|uniref:M56 family metallopeptidase n=1 Tax=Parabacteroides sp. ASD2025 TaxID=3415987 RepID=UPI003CE67C49